MKNNKLIFQLDKNTAILLFALNILFIAYFFTLAFYNRLSQDDFLFLKSVHNSGCLNLVKWSYFFQSGRFTHYIYIAIIFLLIDKTGQFFFIPIIVWIIDFSILLFILKKNLNINYFLSINLSALLFNIFIISNFEFTAFYWICATFYYIQPLLIILFFVQINTENVSKYQYFALIILAILISGSSEIFVPFCLLIIILNFGFYYFKNKNDFTLTIYENRSNRLILLFIIILIGYIFVLVAPGNYIRAKEAIFNHPFNFLSFLKIASQSFLMFYYLLAFKFPYIIVLILIAFMFGVINKASLFIDFTYKRFLLFSWCSYFLFILLNIIPAAYLMSGFGFQRIYTSTIFFSILFFVVQSFFLGLKTKKHINLKFINRLILINLLILILVMILNLVLDIPAAKKYSQSDIERTNLLLDLKSKHHKKLVKLMPLSVPYTYNLKYLILNKKQPMIYYINEIASDTSSYSSMCIRSFYELKFPICLK